MSDAQYRVSIGWTGRLSGYFVVGVSTIAPASNTPGYDVLGDNIAVPGYKGTYDILADDKYGPLNFTCTRGRDDNFSNILAGQLDLVLNDVYPGRYNPKNPLSPLYGQIVPFRPVRLDTSLDGGASWIGMFNGWLDESSSNVDWDSGSAKMTFKDIFLWLDRAKNITIAPTGVTTVGAVINLILNAIGWPVALRSIAAGSTIPNFSLSPGTSALEAIGALLTVDQGYFFHGRDNIVTYWDRYEIARKTSIGTFDSATEALPGVSLSNIRNTATATKTGGVPQYAENSASISLFTPGAWDDVTSDYFVNDGNALSFCQSRVALGKDPLSPVWTYTVQEGTTGYLPLILASEFLDRVSITQFGATTDYNIQKIIHKGEGGTLHKTDWVLAEVPKNMPFIVGVSLIAPAVDSAGYDRVWY